MSSQLRKVTLIAHGQSQEWLSAVGPFCLLTEKPEPTHSSMCKYELIGSPCECTCTPKVCSCPQCGDTLQHGEHCDWCPSCSFRQYDPPTYDAWCDELDSSERRWSMCAATTRRKISDDLRENDTEEIEVV